LRPANDRNNACHEQEKGMLTRSSVIFVVVGICWLVYTTRSLSQAVPPGAEKTKEIQPLQNQGRSKVENKRLSGTVVSIDSVTKTLVIKNWRGETIFDIDGLKTAHRADSEDVKPGDRVRISYIEKNGKKTARAIIVTAARSEGGGKTELPAVKRLKQGPGKN
jgi:hypothetical protein